MGDDEDVGGLFELFGGPDLFGQGGGDLRPFGVGRGEALFAGGGRFIGDLQGAGGELFKEASGLGFDEFAGREGNDEDFFGADEEEGGAVVAEPVFEDGGGGGGEFLEFGQVFGAATIGGGELGGGGFELAEAGAAGFGVGGGGGALETLAEGVDGAAEGFEFGVASEVVEQEAGAAALTDFQGAGVLLFD